MDDKNDKKLREILKEGEKSTTEIASILNSNHYTTLSILENSKIIEKIQVGKYTFWRLKDEN